MPADIRVLLADDTLIAREGWRKILATESDITVVGEATLAQQTAHQVRALRPDVVLLDLIWWDDRSAGLAAIQQIRQQGLPVKIIAVTVEHDLARDARQAGADAVLPKGFTRDDLVNLIRTLAQMPGVTAAAQPSAGPAPPAPVGPVAPAAQPHPAHLLAAIGVPVLGFVLIASALLLGVRGLTWSQMAAVASLSLVVFLFVVVFAARYVGVLGETSTYRLMARLLDIVRLKLPGFRAPTRRGSHDPKD
jgi:CheY-like chemotaxis protein